MRKDTKGVITLEACVSVLAFMILMLMLSSLFIMFIAQNVTAHVTLQTAQSLAIDVYSIENYTVDKDKTIKDEATSLENEFGKLLTRLLGRPSKDSSFISTERWNAESAEAGEVARVVRQRYIGYLASGDEAEADKILKQYRVIDGLNGMDFSESHVTDGTLYVVVKFKLVYDFTYLAEREFPVTQTACAKIWKH